MPPRPVEPCELSHERQPRNHQPVPGSHLPLRTHQHSSKQVKPNRARDVSIWHRHTTAVEVRTHGVQIDIVPGVDVCERVVNQSLDRAKRRAIPRSVVELRAVGVVNP